ncbi:MAG: outer membrane protein transport protein [Bacteroidota bacterium]|jgi:hypothetical protein
MKKIFSIAGLCAAFLIVTINARAQYSQYLDDALRYSTPGLGVSARSLGMGTAYTGVANDFSAVFSNPAGLGQMRMSEVTLGMSNVSYGNTSTFFNSSQSLTNSSTSLNNLGLVYSLPVQQGSLVLAVGFGREADYTSGLSFQGYNPGTNPVSSIVQMWAPNNQTLSQYESIAEQLYLAVADTITNKFVSPINGKLTQSGTVLESGGQNYVTVSGAIEASKNFYIGATLNFISGSYSYVRNYQEEDLANVYTRANTVTLYNNNKDTTVFDLNYLTSDQTLEHDISGFSMKLGMLYKFGPGSRLGIAIKTPSWITVHETYSEQASSTFDNGDHYALPASSSNYDYDIASPYVFSAGLSHSIGDLMLAGDVEYTDWTQMQFSNASAELMSLNTTFKTEFRPTVNYRLGGEYEFSSVGFRLRGGFAYLPSPYNGDPSSFAQKYITGGLGFIIADAFSIDIGYAHGYWDTKHAQLWDINGNPTAETTEKISTDNLIGTISYRF